jgi:SAM-dependent methyltransferase
VLDVGCGDGLIGFGALERVGPAGKVIFSDIAQGLVDHCRSLAAEKGVLERCAFLRASVDDLSALPADSVDAVTARSVLCHVPPPGKAPALREFHRVLKPGRRLSMFDPINRFPALHPEPPHLLWGYDISAAQPLADKVRAFFRRAQPIAEHPSLHFDERDLFELAVAARPPPAPATPASVPAPPGGTAGTRPTPTPHGWSRRPTRLTATPDTAPGRPRLLVGWQLHHLRVVRERLSLLPPEPAHDPVPQGEGAQWGHHSPPGDASASAARTCPWHT